MDTAIVMVSIFSNVIFFGLVCTCICFGCKTKQSQPGMVIRTVPTGQGTNYTSYQQPVSTQVTSQPAELRVDLSAVNPPPYAQPKDVPPTYDEVINEIFGLPDDTNGSNDRQVTPTTRVSTNIPTSHRHEPVIPSNRFSNRSTGMSINRTMSSSQPNMMSSSRTMTSSQPNNMASIRTMTSSEANNKSPNRTVTSSEPNNLSSNRTVTSSKPNHLSSNRIASSVQRNVHTVQRNRNTDSNRQHANIHRIQIDNNRQGRQLQYRVLYI